MVVPTEIDAESGALPTIVRIRDTNTNDRYDSDDGYDGYNYAGAGASTVINPVIISVSAEPIEGGASLFVDAWSSGEYVHYYQWQVQQADGTWVNIPGATGSWVNIPGETGATFEYTGLAPGEYTVRCIVTNSSGGETISEPVTFVVS